MRITINEPATFQDGAARVDVIADPITHELDPSLLGAAPSRALAESITAGIAGIGATAAPATLRYREEARRGVAKGARWAMARYPDGGPNRSDKLFNDSGELARGIRVQASGDSWVITAPRNRLALPGATRGATIALLAEHVPAVADPLGDKAVQQAIADSFAVIFGH